MGFAYNHAVHSAWTKQIDMANDDIRLLLVMTNSTCGLERNVTTLSGFGTLDEFDGANYVRKVTANNAIVKNATLNRSEFSFDDVVFSTLGPGTRQILGAVLIQWNTNDADALPLGFIDSGGFPKQGNSDDFTLRVGPTGAMRFFSRT